MTARIGDLVTAQVYWNQGGLWKRDRQPNWSDAEYQIRNWLYYTWLSGDHICEQHVHNLDVMNWAFDAHPVKRCVALGGRQVRTAPIYGNIFDHFAVEYEYPGRRARPTSQCRQIDGCANNVSETIVGTKGSSSSQPGNYRQTGGTGRPDPHPQRAEPLRAGAHRPGREHPLGQAAERAEDGRREHPDGDHGPDVGLHRPGRHLGAGARTRSST